MLKSEALEFEEKVAKTLSKGILAQITLVITGFLADYSAVPMLLVLSSCYLVLLFLRVQESLQRLLLSVAINQALSAVVTSEVGLTLLNLLAVFLLGSAFEENDTSGTAQYMFAVQVSDILQVQDFIGVVVVLAVYMQVQVFASMPRIKETLLLVVMYVLQGWILRQIPRDAQMPCMFMILYALYPFLTTSDKALNFYNFILMSFTASLHYNEVSYWVQCVFAGVVYLAHFDDISRAVGQNVCMRLFTVATVQSILMLARTDPLLVYGMLLIGLHFLMN